MRKFEDKARIFSYGFFSNDIVFVLSVLRKQQNMTEKEKNVLLRGVKFLDGIIRLEETGNQPMCAGEKLDLLWNKCEFINMWILSKVSFPKNDKEFLERLNKYRDFFRKAADVGEISDGVVFGELLKIFETMDTQALFRIHRSSLHDLPSIGEEDSQ